MNANTDALAQRATALARLIEDRLPLEEDATGPADAWPLVGSALLAHATSNLNSIFRLRSHAAHNDSSRLLRSLYDHVVTFAWLAVEPPGRIAVWRKADLEARLKIDKEFTQASQRLLPDAVRSQMERDVDSVEGSAPGLADKALRADEHWIPRIAHLGSQGFSSFRGLYTVLFRQHSGLVHATMRGLNHVTVDLSPTRRRVLLEAPLDGRGPYGLATVVYGLGILVAAESLGWSSGAEVEAIFARYPD